MDEQKEGAAAYAKAQIDRRVSGLDECNDRSETQGVIGAAIGDREVSRAQRDEFALSELFRYHRPQLDQLPKYENLREAAHHFAKVVLMNVPPGSDRNAAIRKIREAVMTANAGVALNGFEL